MRFVLGLLFVFFVLLDAFETIVLPRTVRRPIRLVALFFALSRFTFERFKRVGNPKFRTTLLSAFAPLSMIMLIAVWAIVIVFGFALMESGLNIPMNIAGGDNFVNRLYFSGVTFFTIGFGDITPADPAGRFMAVVEGGMGLGFLALVIGYIPVLYAAFSRREITMLLLDSKAGSNPTAAEMLRRHAEAGCMPMLTPLLKDWETFSAQSLEAYLSYPVLALYRSQHDDQSWLTSLCAVMDACALIDVGCLGGPEWEKELRFQAKATFAMARHVVVDLSYVLRAEPITGTNRLKPDELEAIGREMAHYGVKFDFSPTALTRLEQNRTLYEPYVAGLSSRLAMDLPDWCPPQDQLDNWQTSAWDVKHF